MSAPALELDGVWVERRGETVLEDLSLRVEEREFLAILGPNGAGKTTLLELVLGLVRPARGRVRVLGDAPARARGRVGYVPQRARFDPEFPIRVGEVVRMGLLRGPRSARADGRRRVERALERVEIRDLAERPIGALSGGQLQRVLIARALALEPRLLLLDEPTASLDERIGRTLWELLEELSRQLTIVLVSHDIGAISRYVRSVACLNRRLFAHPTQELSAEILEATYGCPVELLAHGHPHRVLGSHPERR